MGERLLEGVNETLVGGGWEEGQVISFRGREGGVLREALPLPVVLQSSRDQGGACPRAVKTEN